jgi:hypothetical protein
VATDDGIDGIEDRNVDNCEGPARSVGAQLFPEGAILAGAHGRVVESVGDEENLVPAPDRVIAA